MDKNQNNTFIEQIVYASQLFRIIESIVKLFFLSFFLGVFWYLACYHQTYLFEEFNGLDEPDFL